MTKEDAFNKKRALFTSRLGLNLRKKLVKCCIARAAFMVLRFGHFGD
jgi:hypothetical protein